MAKFDKLEYVRNYYNVPAYKGVRISYQGKQGVIVDGDGPYISIRLDGETIARPYHPKDGITYLIEQATQ